MPFKVLEQMIQHPLRASGITQFRAAWEEAQRAT
jgi:hypothetical protein